MSQSPNMPVSRRVTLTDELMAYVESNSLREHPAQSELRTITDDLPLSVMQIGPEQGQFLALLVKALGARRTIEVGVYTGYSALSVALALPDDGRVLACDISEDWANVGVPLWKAARVSHKIDLRIAPANETLKAELERGLRGQYDFAFIDADKANYDLYYELCLELLRKGGIIAIDNTLWGGSVATETTDPDTAAIQALNKKIHADERVYPSLLPIGDGLTLALKL